MTFYQHFLIYSNNRKFCKRKNKNQRELPSNIIFIPRITFNLQIINNEMDLQINRLKLRKKTLWTQITGRKGRLVLILVGALLIFLVEFSLGLWAKSLSLIAVSIHEINDSSVILIALVIHTVCLIIIL